MICKAFYHISMCFFLYCQLFQTKKVPIDLCCVCNPTKNRKMDRDPQFLCLDGMGNGVFLFISLCAPAGEIIHFILEIIVNRT